MIKVKKPICSYIFDPMTSKNVDFTRLSGLFGMLAPLVALISIGLAILLSPWFSFTGNYLSDLGGRPDSDRLWDTHGNASIIFNFGLVIAGIFGICFGIGIKKSGMFKSRIGDLGMAFLLLAACMLVGIGLFSETTGVIHTIFSYAFFILAGFAALFLGIDHLKSSERTLGWFIMGLFIFGLISVPLFIAPKPVGSNAIAELIPIISISLFSLVFGYKLFMMDPRVKSPSEL